MVPAVLEKVGGSTHNVNSEELVLTDSTFTSEVGKKSNPSILLTDTPLVSIEIVAIKV